MMVRCDAAWLSYCFLFTALCWVAVAVEPLEVLVDAGASQTSCTMIDEGTGLPTPICGVLPECTCVALRLGLSTADSIMHLSTRGGQSVNITTPSGIVDFPLQNWAGAELKLSSGIYASADDVGLSIQRGNVTISYRGADVTEVQMAGAGEPFLSIETASVRLQGLTLCMFTNVSSIIHVDTASLFLESISVQDVLDGADQLALVEAEGERSDVAIRNLLIVNSTLHSVVFSSCQLEIEVDSMNLENVTTCFLVSATIDTPLLMSNVTLDLVHFSIPLIESRGALDLILTGSGFAVLLEDWTLHHVFGGGVSFLRTDLSSRGNHTVSISEWEVEDCFLAGSLVTTSGLSGMVDGVSVMTTESSQPLFTFEDGTFAVNDIQLLWCSIAKGFMLGETADLSMTNATIDSSNVGGGWIFTSPNLGHGASLLLSGSSFVNVAGNPVHVVGSDLRIEGCAFSDVAGSLLLTSRSTESIVVSNCTMEHTIGLGMTTKGNLTMTGCSWLSEQPSYISFSEVSPAHVFVTDCNFQNVGVVSSVETLSFELCIFDNPVSTTPFNPSLDFSLGSLLVTGKSGHVFLVACTFRNNNLSYLDSPDDIPLITLPSAVTLMPSHPCLLTVAGSTFDNCFGGQGGAIKSHGADLEVSFSAFRNCSAVVGGAIVFEDGEASISNSEFLGTSALLNGGAIEAGGKSSLYLGYSRLVDCSAGDFGGGAFVAADAVGVFYQSLFENCTAQYGGACTAAGTSSVDSQYSQFRNCYATASGGAVLVKDDSSPMFFHSEFTGNSAGGNAGGIFIAGSSHPSIEDCLLSGNSALNSGGGLYIQDTAAPFILRVSVSNNTASVHGGGMHYSMYSSPSMAWCNFTGNTAGISGGAVAATDYARPSLVDSIFMDNHAASGGAASADAWTQPYFQNCHWENNSARSAAGAVMSGDQAAVLLSACSFSRNFVTGEDAGGGALASLQLSRVNVSYCNFIGNRAKRSSGGAILNLSAGRSIYDGSKFKANVAFDMGGGLSATTAGGMEISNCEFSENFAERRGGALAVIDNHPVLVTGCNFTSNSAITDGGGIFLSDVLVTMRDLLVSDNFIWSRTDAPSGGGIYCGPSSAVSLRNAMIRNNTAVEGLGGGLYAAGKLSMTNCSLVSNIAMHGGGIYLDLTEGTNTSSTSLGGVTLTENRATGNGGAMFFKTVNPVVSPSSTLQVRAGLTSDPSFSCFLKELRFIRNQAGWSGGAAYMSMSNGPLLFEQALFQGNRATYLGGALFYTKGSGEQLLSECSFTNNSALWGGCNVGFRAVDDADAVKTSSSIRTNFTVPANVSGYQDMDGFASYPLELAYANATQCPGGLPLDADPFDVLVGLIDAFGSSVVGALLEADLYVIGMNYTGSNCAVGADANEMISPVAWSTGMATYTNITLQGKDGGTCQLEFTTRPTRGSAGSYTMSKNAMACSVTLSGCGEGEVVVSGGTYDTCEPEPFNILALVMVCLVLGLCCVVLALLLFNAVRGYTERRKRLEAAYYDQLEIDDELLAPGAITLEDILNDPEISQIRWSELTVGKKIGRGASGVVTAAVWREEASGVEQDVALKELAFNLVELEQAAIEDFLVEIKLMSALRHSHVVRFLGVSYNEDTLYLVTELMQYGSLADVLAKKGKNLSWRLKMKLVMDAAKGMRYLHGKKLIHRDLKPQNLLVNNQWACKVADFGISRVKTATRTMTVIGTPVFMAPEVLNNERYSEKADVYSFGILLVQVFTGRRPYSEYATLNDAQLMFKIYHDGLRPSTAGLPGLLKQLADEALLSEAKLRPSFEEVTLRLARLKQLDAPEGTDTAAPADEEEVVVDFMDADDISSSSRHSSASSATSSLFSSAPSMGDLTSGPSEGLVATGKSACSDDGMDGEQLPSLTP